MPEGAADPVRGAKPGDHFVLQGEMLTLPPGQGSRSTCWLRCCCCWPREAGRHRRQRLDVHRRRGRVPDPNCPTRLRIVRTGSCRFRHADTSGCRCRAATRMGAAMIPRSRSRRTTDLAAGQGRLAPAGGPRRDRRASQATRDMPGSSRRASPPSTAPTSTPASRNWIGRFPAASIPALARQVRVHQVRAGPSTRWRRSMRALRRGRSSTASLRRLGQERLDLVQFHWWGLRGTALRRGGAAARGCAAPARSTGSASHFGTAQLRRCWRPACRYSRTSCSIRC